MIPTGELDYGQSLINLRKIIDNHWYPGIVKKDEDRLVVIEGKEGSSKSTLALHIAYYFMAKQGKEFDIKNIHYSVKTFVEGITNSVRGQVRIIDEGALLGFSRDVMSKDTKYLVKTLTTCRSKNNLILICVPNINLLDKYLREHRLAAVLRVTLRGRCDVYNVHMWKAAHYKEKFSKKIKIQRSPLHDSYPMIQNLEGQVFWNRYLDHKHKQLSQDLPKIKDEQDIKDEVIYQLHLNGMGYEKIGESLGMPWQTVRNSVYRVRKALKTG